MLAPDQSPFPDNPTCKLCITKPCRQLFTGRVYPGKMIFVHHSEFLSWPCHTPNFSATNENSGEEAALTDEIVVITGQVAISDPRWEPVVEGAPTDHAVIGDTIRLMADVRNYPDGAPVTFEIFDRTKEPAFRIGTARGKNEGGIGKAEWQVDDPNGHGSSLKLEFDAEVRSRKSTRAEIKVKTLITGGIHLVFEDDRSRLLENIEVKIKAGDEEIYSGIVDSGEIGLTGIPFAELTAECGSGGTTVSKALHWNGGKPPYTKEVVLIPASATTGEEA